LFGTWYGDCFIGGSDGVKQIFGRGGNDIYIITNGDYGIASPTGSEKIKLLNGIRISSFTKTYRNREEEYVMELTNGAMISIPEFIDKKFAISVIDENDRELGKIVDDNDSLLWIPTSAPQSQFVSKTAGTESPTTKFVLIEGWVTVTVIDEAGNVLETLKNNVDATIHRKYGHFHITSGTEAVLEAILFNGNYKLKVESNNITNYGIVNFDEKNEPLVLLSVEAPLTSDRYLDTSSVFDTDGSVPSFIIKDSVTDETIEDLAPTVTDLVDPPDEDDPDPNPGASPSEDKGSGGGGCSAYGVNFVVFVLVTVLCLKKFDLR
jgi:hypothetical protein